jgi:hypothetical protein
MNSLYVSHVIDMRDYSILFCWDVNGKFTVIAYNGEEDWLL